MTNGQDLGDKVCIITGVSSPHGIGHATAIEFASRGAKALYLCDRDPVTTPSMEQLSELLSQQYPQTAIHLRSLDVSDEESIKAIIVDAHQTYSQIDIFFANAGIIGALGSLTSTTASQAQEIWQVNFTSLLWAIKYAVPRMKAGSGIIATASVAGLRANAGPSLYSASKAAVINLVQTAAYQYAHTGIRFNAVLPGLIETGMTMTMFDEARRRGTAGKIGQLNPLGRAGHAKEVAKVVAFLASDQASYVNGQAWAVDGGLSAGLPFVRGKLA